MGSGFGGSPFWFCVYSCVCVLISFSSSIISWQLFSFTNVSVESYLLNWLEYIGISNLLSQTYGLISNYSGDLSWLLPGKSHGRRSLVGSVHGVARSRTWLSDFIFIFPFSLLCTVFRIVLFSSISLHWSLRKVFLSLLTILCFFVCFFFNLI